ncbi:hypothetical protein MCOR25_010768 [Pyricularia grisea]|uniref:Uncharacterized protein n=1 Tax=Pyricularia grisea TaxID=148305 RepID=A0A6P8AS81_PYRGI|nr:uncharacterized protein PgNI_09228 [Pyricularia grisea]KAI6348609.1 hypothetical protein MCOR25_010768 [Pyricularia grisea]TLD04952.1 hypothetical protein PgNI_09228 [Pyricularia grisea]
MSNIPHPGLFPESLTPSPASYHFSTLACCVPASTLVALLCRAATHEDNNPIPLMIALGATLISWTIGNLVDTYLSAGAMQLWLLQSATQRHLSSISTMAKTIEGEEPDNALVQGLPSRLCKLRGEQLAAERQCGMFAMRSGGPHVQSQQKVCDELLAICLEVEVEVRAATKRGLERYVASLRKDD